MITRMPPQSLFLLAGAVAFWLSGSTARAVPLSPTPAIGNASNSSLTLAPTSGGRLLVSGVLRALSTALGENGSAYGADSSLLRETRSEPTIVAAIPTPDDDPCIPAALVQRQKSTKGSDDIAGELLCGSEQDPGERSDTQQRDRTTDSGLTTSTSVLHAEMVSRVTIAGTSRAIAPHLLGVFHPPRCARA
jgi:hypothetical protein